MSEDRALNNRELISAMSGMEEKERLVAEKIDKIVGAIAQTKQKVVNVRKKCCVFW